MLRRLIVPDRQLGGTPIEGVDSGHMEDQRYTPLDVQLMAGLGSLALVAAILMAWYITERLPHLEDEIAYLFQARTLARGALAAPVPFDESPFFTPFVLPINGHRVGKYPIGWPLILAAGEAIGAGWLVNPLLGALTVVLTYALGRDLFNRQVGLIAGLLALTSPFFLIQSSTYMSHAAAALWTALFTYAFLRSESARARGQPGRGWVMAMGLAAGMLAITRPLTAVAVMLPFGVFLLVQSIRQGVAFHALARAYWPGALMMVAIALLQPLYLTLVTGSPTTNLYRLVWPYDRIGFGPGFGPSEGGHSLRQALITARIDLQMWASDLFGWPGCSWVPVVPGLILGTVQIRPERKAWPGLLVGIFASLVVVHLAYWVGGNLYGPRYYYEAHAGLAVVGAVGLVSSTRLAVRAIRWLVSRRTCQKLPAELPIPAWPACLLVATLVAVGMLTYLPSRLSDWHGMYGISREPLDHLAGLAGERPVLVLVRGGLWNQYASFFALNSPWYDGPVVAAHDLNLRSSYAVMAMYPNRDVWFYSNGQFSPEPFPYDGAPPP